MASSSRRPRTGRGLENESHDLINRSSINVPRFLNTSIDLGVDILTHFEETGLRVLLQCGAPFRTDLVRLFYNNLSWDGQNWAVLRSHINGFPLVLYASDFATIFGLPDDGPEIWGIADFRRQFDWSNVNQALHNRPVANHISDLGTISQDAFHIQYILRHTLLQKAGDSNKLNPALSLATYFILNRQRFNAVHSVMMSIVVILRLKEPNYSRSHNLCLGHVIEFTLLSKYPDLDLRRMPIDLHPRAFSPTDFHRMHRRIGPAPPPVARAPSMSTRMDRFDRVLDRLDRRTGWMLQHWNDAAQPPQDLIDGGSDDEEE